MTLIDVASRHARAARDADARAVAAGDERERAVVDVEQRTLGTFEQQPLAASDGVEQQVGRVAHVRSQPLGIGRVFAEDVGRIERLEIRPAGYSTSSTRFLAATMCSTCARKRRAIQVAQPDRVRAADLVAIARADAAPRGADVFAVRRVFVECPIFGKVPGKDHVSAIADAQIVRVPGAALGQLVELLDHTGRIDHHARADDARHAGRKNAAGQQRQLVDLVADDDGVAGVAPPW